MRPLSVLACLCVGIAAITGLGACGASDEEPSGSAGSSSASGEVTQAKSEKARDEAPSLLPSEIQQLAEGNQAFATDLYGKLAELPGNLIFSPHSTSVALAMTFAGARTTTEQQMAATLHFTLPQEKLHSAFNQLDLELQKLNKAADPANGKGFKLNVANSLWGQKGTPFFPQFLDTLALNYGAGMNLVDFVGNSEGARVAINDWVAAATEDKIENLLAKGDVNSSTRLVLTNAIYFNGSWKDAFNESLTADGTFHSLSDGDVTAKLMHGGGSMRYAETADFQAVELPYASSSTAMLIVLPQPGKFETVEASLSSSWLRGVWSSEQAAPVNLTVPKFSFRTRAYLASTLSSLGMPEAFSGAADFSGMVDPKDDRLSIAEVVHEAFIGVDEKGTEAAAATAVVMIDGGVAPNPPTPKDVVADRPFLFFIHDFSTGAVLFGGRVVNPSKS